jgi:hypothetical protein
MVVIDARFDGKNFVPEQVPEGIPVNTRVTVTIPTISRPTGLDAIIGIAKDLDLPPDFAAQHEHYTHGTPKR